MEDSSLLRMKHHVVMQSDRWCSHLSLRPLRLCVQRSTALREFSRSPRRSFDTQRGQVCGAWLYLSLLLLLLLTSTSTFSLYSSLPPPEQKQIFCLCIFTSKGRKPLAWKEHTHTHKHTDKYIHVHGHTCHKFRLQFQSSDFWQSHTHHVWTRVIRMWHPADRLTAEKMVLASTENGCHVGGAFHSPRGLTSAGLDGENFHLVNCTAVYFAACHSGTMWSTEWRLGGRVTFYQCHSWIRASRCWWMQGSNWPKPTRTCIFHLLKRLMASLCSVCGVSASSRLEQASGLRARNREQAAVSQDALGDVRRPLVWCQGHGGATDQPHWEGLRPGNIQWKVSAKTLR